MPNIVLLSGNARASIHAFINHVLSGEADLRSSFYDISGT